MAGFNVITEDASVLDLVSLPAIFSAQEIGDGGLQGKVQKAKGSVAEMLESAVSSMEQFGFTRAEVSAMADVKLKSHAANMRRVLFPSEQPQEGAEKKDVRSNSINCERGEQSGIEMNEAEMKAELERLRAENARPKTKKKEASL